MIEQIVTLLLGQHNLNQWELNAYMNPLANIDIRITRCFFAICNVLKKKSGIASNAKSFRILTAEMT